MSVLKQSKVEREQPHNKESYLATSEPYLAVWSPEDSAWYSTWHALFLKAVSMSVSSTGEQQQDTEYS